MTAGDHPVLEGVVLPSARVGGAGPGSTAPTQWTMWARTGAVDPGPDARWWRDPQAALDAAAGTGARVVAFSAEWAAVEPAPGEISAEVLDRYAAVCAMCAERGLTPMVTLYDGTHPAWLGEEPWLTPGAPDRFCGFAARVVTRLGAACRHWVSVARPNLLALGGWVGGHVPPRRVGALSDAWAVLDNLLSGHVLVHTAVHELHPEATVALSVRQAVAYDHARILVDLLAAPALGVAHHAIDEWVEGRRTLHGQLVAAPGAAAAGARRLAGRLSPYGVDGPGAARALGIRRRAPRRALDLAYAAPGSVLDALVVDWGPPAADVLALPARAWPLGRHPMDVGRGALERWLSDQRVLTPGVSLWVEDASAAPGDLGPAPAAGVAGWRRPFGA